MKNPLKKRFARTEENQNSGEYKEWKPNPLGALPTTLVNISSETKRISDNHVAVFPVEFASYFIQGATNPGDIVLDPFMGTGTTAVASKKLGRNFIGFETQLDYITLADKRISEV
jgi:hypothetical protein